jgi:hypothetical protein
MQMQGEGMMLNRVTQNHKVHLINVQMFSFPDNVLLPLPSIGRNIHWPLEQLSTEIFLVTRTHLAVRAAAASQQMPRCKLIRFQRRGYEPIFTLDARVSQAFSLNDRPTLATLGDLQCILKMYSY